MVGLQGAMLRMVCARYTFPDHSGVQLASYDLSKSISKERLGIQDGLLLHVSSAIVASVFLAVAVNPSDVVLTRLQNQNPAERVRIWLTCRSIEVGGTA